MKEFIYYAKGFDEVFSVWARTAEVALAKVRREWGVSNLNVKIMER